MSAPCHTDLCDEGTEDEESQVAILSHELRKRERCEIWTLKSKICSQYTASLCILTGGFDNGYSHSLDTHWFLKICQ